MDAGVTSILGHNYFPDEGVTTNMSSPRVWFISVISGSGDYEDDVPTCYQYDNKVPNSRQISVGDIAFVRKDDLIAGAARVEKIEEWDGTKEFLRCPHCQSHRYRKVKGGDFRCDDCKGSDFKHPEVRTGPVKKLSARYGSSWHELPGETSVKEFRDRLGWPSSSGKGGGSIQEVPDESREGRRRAAQRGRHRGPGRAPRGRRPEQSRAS